MKLAVLMAKQLGPGSHFERCLEFAEKLYITCCSCGVRSSHRGLAGTSRAWEQIKPCVDPPFWGVRCNINHTHTPCPATYKTYKTSCDVQDGVWAGRAPCCKGLSGAMLAWVTPRDAAAVFRRRLESTSLPPASPS